MSKISVKAGKGEITLRKSRSLVGLKSKSRKNLSDASFIKEEVLPNLGGFNIVTLDRKRGSVDKKLDEVRQEDDVQTGTHVYHVEGSKRPVVPTGEIFIIFQNGTSEEEQQMALEEFHLHLVERRDTHRVVASVTEKSLNPIKVAHFMQKTALVKVAEPDLDTLLDEYDFIRPDDDLLDHQWYFKNTGQVIDANYRLKKGADARILDAWTRIGSMGSGKVTVAIIDNGFDLEHPDLKEKVFKPFDLWNQSPAMVVGDPRFTHGTPCASLAIGASNGHGIVGVAPHARFMPVSGTSFSLRATEDMFNYCIKNGADIISCSWGTTDPAFNLSPMKEEIIAKAAREGRGGKGCIVLYAVGNDDLDFVSFYSAHPDVIAVAACTSRDEHAGYSNRGREVSICAPSNGDWPVIAARAAWDEGVSWRNGENRWWFDGVSRGNRYKHFGGTSAACPLVAGICALILSVHPDLTAREVKDILQSTADKIGPPSEYVNGHSTKYGYGRVNADRAVAEAIRRRDKGSEPVVVEDSIKSGRGIFRFHVSKQEPKGFGVQIGAFAEYGNVLIQAEKLQKSFSEPIIVSINELESKTVYKIVVGAFAKKSEASKLLGRIKDSGLDGFVRNLKDLE
ncbi:MAG: S8 family serine peptidase [Bacteroidota bacterium]